MKAHPIEYLARRWRRGHLAGGLLVLGTGAAYAAGGTGSAPSEAVFLAELVALMLIGRLHADTAPDRAIRAEARRTQSPLIVMGVSRRPGARLSFGDTAAAVLAHAPGSVMFVAS